MKKYLQIKLIFEGSHFENNCSDLLKFGMLTIEGGGHFHTKRNDVKV